ncbi:MAG: purine-nucleoside phosphorylase [Elusimicrobiota bacterium]
MSGEKMFEKIKEAALWLNNRTGNFSPEILMITGSGLSNAVPELKDRKVIPYDEIPGFSRTTVSGHKGELWLGEAAGKKIAVMRGRFHFYEGHHMSYISFPIRLLHYLGARKLIVTAAVGSLKKNIAPGDLVILKDQINMMSDNPLIGNYSPVFGEMFVDMNEPYDIKSVAAAEKICKALKIKAHKGVYFAVTGPAYETAAEVKMYAKLGGDVAGMSVVPEVIVGRQLKMKVLGLAWISNFATGISKKEFDHSLVLKLGETAGEKIKKVIEKLISSGSF